MITKQTISSSIDSRRQRFGKRRAHCKKASTTTTASRSTSEPNVAHSSATKKRRSNGDDEDSPKTLRQSLVTLRELCQEMNINWTIKGCQAGSKQRELLRKHVKSKPRHFGGGHGGGGHAWRWNRDDPQLVLVRQLLSNEFIKPLADSKTTNKLQNTAIRSKQDDVLAAKKHKGMSGSGGRLSPSSPPPSEETAQKATKQNPVKTINRDHLTSHRKRKATMTIDEHLSLQAKLVRKDIGQKQEGKGKRPPNLNSNVADYLKAWMMNPKNINHPYPTEDEKKQMMLDTGLNAKQLKTWFTNNRRRLWKPLVLRSNAKGTTIEQQYQAETVDTAEKETVGLSFQRKRPHRGEIISGSGIISFEEIREQVISESEDKSTINFENFDRDTATVWSLVGLRQISVQTTLQKLVGAATNRYSVSSRVESSFPDLHQLACAASEEYQRQMMQ